MLIILWQTSRDASALSNLAAVLLMLLVLLRALRTPNSFQHRLVPWCMLAIGSKSIELSLQSSRVSGGGLYLSTRLPFCEQVLKSEAVLRTR